MGLLEFFTPVALLLYALAVSLGVIGILSHENKYRHLASSVALAGFLAQSVCVALTHMSMPFADLSRGQYLQLLAWCIVLIGLLFRLKVREDSPLIFSVLVAFLLYMFSFMFLGVHNPVPQSVSAVFYAIHTGSLYLSLALLALATGAGGVFIWLDRRMKAKAPINSVQKSLPALAVLDTVNALTAKIGFPLYSLGILSGFLWAKPVWGRSISGDPKEIISVLVWLLFAFFFRQRLSQGWRGRKPAMLVILIFCLCVFSILVVNTFMPTHHSFAGKA